MFSKNKKTMVCAFLVCCVHFCNAGSLEPSAPPAPTMKTLAQIEPRVDVASLPSTSAAVFTISESGSYYLSSDVEGVAGKNGIVIEASNVRLDLNGFGLIGAAETLNGILISSGSKNVAICNGSINNWGQAGIDGDSSSGVIVETVSVSDNSGPGMHLGLNSIIKTCTSIQNSQFGIIAEDNSLVISCVSRSNGFGGFRIHSGGLITSCVAEGNSFEGILAIYEVKVKDNACSFNQWGIVSTDRNYISNNLLNLNSQGGIRCGGQGNVVLSNQVAGSGGTAGIQLTDGSTKNLVVKNSVTGYATGYDIFSGNTYGPIIDISAGGDLSTLMGAEHPWANFEN